MNGLLQSLFHAGEFRHRLPSVFFQPTPGCGLRRIVYSIECEKEEKASEHSEAFFDSFASVFCCLRKMRRWRKQATPMQKA